MNIDLPATTTTANMMKTFMMIDWYLAKMEVILQLTLLAFIQFHSIKIARAQSCVITNSISRPGYDNIILVQ